MEEQLKYLKYYLDVNVPTIWDDESYTVPLTVANIFEVIRDKHKLILRPLSDLVKEIEIDGEKIYPIQGIRKHMRHLDYSHLWVIAKGEVLPTILQFPIIEKLIEWHFDLFGLIEKGYAVDVNTIKEKV